MHVNAFNFPAWGMVEKAAVALLAGMPVITKPATRTALVAHRIVELVVEAKVLPEGALSFIAGGVGDLLAHLGGQDVLAFTGSSDTGAMLRAQQERGRRVGARQRRGRQPERGGARARRRRAAREGYSLFIADVVRDMTQKTGQKCTAIRRVLVPSRHGRGRARRSASSGSAAIKVGDPAREDVTHGAGGDAQQLRDVRAGIARLREEARQRLRRRRQRRRGGRRAEGQGLLRLAGAAPGARRARRRARVHEHEVFGPVATLMPYRRRGRRGRARGARRRRPGVVGLLRRRAFLGEMAFGLAPYHGRLFLGSSKIAGHAVGPGTVLPQLVHGGPGAPAAARSSAALRGLAFYLQRTAVAGDKPILEALFRASEKTN